MGSLREEIVKENTIVNFFRPSAGLWSRDQEPLNHEHQMMWRCTTRLLFIAPESEIFLWLLLLPSRVVGGIQRAFRTEKVFCVSTRRADERKADFKANGEEEVIEPEEEEEEGVWFRLRTESRGGSCLCPTGTQWMSRIDCMEELLLSGCTERKRPQLCQCVYSAESGRLGAPVCGSPAASSRTLNKRISRVLGEPGRPQAVGVRTGAHARMCDDPPPHPPESLMPGGRGSAEGVGVVSVIPSAQTGRGLQVNLWTVCAFISLRSILVAPRRCGLVGCSSLIAHFPPIN